jgi:hypothetical protein
LSFFCLLPLPCNFGAKIAVSHMNQISSNFTATLSMGKREIESGESEGNDPVRVLAKAYEVARNAMEYRADHLVRRAAIERILKRQIIFETDNKNIAETLLQELKWARYLNHAKKESIFVNDIAAIIEKYKSALKNFIDHKWLMGLISAEIEEILNPNTDYHKFTTFAFHVIKAKVNLKNIDNLDLLLYTAVDKVFSQSDEEQVSYHIMKLIRSQTENKTDLTTDKLLEETYKYYLTTVNNSTVNRLAVFIRKQIGPLVLIRDTYFAKPEEFQYLLDDEVRFRESAENVLREQLHKMRGQLNRATVRSLVYVFLTKMLLILLVEVPVERIFKGSGNLMTLLMNMVFPVAFMWILTARIKLPSRKELETLVRASSATIFENQEEIAEDQMLISLEQKGSPLMFVIYYLFYGLLFLGIFYVLVASLVFLKFSVVSMIIFIFFLSLVTFFAFRIKQTAMVYSYKPRVRGGYSFSENLMLPIVTLGGMLSRGVSRLNFFVFLFDFILESPFKIILHFLDKWFAFLSIKKDEVVG